MLFLEKVFLPLLVTVVGAMVIASLTRLDIQQRIALSVCLLSLAYFTAHTMAKRASEAKQVISPVPTATKNQTMITGDAHSEGSQSPAVSGNGNTFNYGGGTKPSAEKPPRGKK